MNTNHYHVISFALWMASIFTFIGMTLSIYWSSCYHLYITLTLQWTSALLWLLTIHSMELNDDYLYSSYDDEVAVVDESNTDHDATRTQQEIP